MPLRIGIVGLPNVGKSTLFNALTRSRQAQAANYPFCTIDPNIGVVEVPDERLAKLAAIVHPEKVIPATAEFVDIAGLVRGASKGEGLGNKFLSHIRNVHAVCEVIRFFEGGDVLHVEGTTDPQRDREILETELALSDLDVLNRRIENIAGAARTGNVEKQQELALAETMKAALERGTLARAVPFDEEERAITLSWNLLTGKPILYAANVSEGQMKEFDVNRARQVLALPLHRSGEPWLSATWNVDIIPISAKLEEELQDLPPEEGKALLSELGMTSSGLDQLVAAAYTLLGYTSFFTAGHEEVRAWTITRGTKAPQAAGVIHTDFEKGFIRAETIAYDDFVRYGGEQGAREAGKLRIEGKNYIVQDGDVMHFL
ncbi:redox-regulated ATPase YchF [Candidatus Peribacteria bacterium RIFCSPLOWO2_12_FULL_55_15]|nr:MAG: redox-regulated ATPase YchF [Candidatus Peribacteria bacterium RIFCSPHIGHO2_01_FULL_54_22]OGJ63551.1 MAG: redox-regulated ATPase YchF [Candidatus Peribacteria bacterium RIFCSPHIGHO2_02_FULL_55_24]OGJ63830.1 MAG: redox-regulated ATPase YchF [Candidatus Peribacteria bacterium RIFCSPHIGHO2_12_FULL_54_10]OGJ67659.1 MAG: redox-regulated ATPase YchF [Candidatus Peribacteria bacterium RIFCSPLOWO2_01_FULL_54_110]OGJ69538.1 MAG: redox-regulated ATPase YchF [Candidatus Peribacteria bacterium RIFC